MVIKTFPELSGSVKTQNFPITQVEDTFSELNLLAPSTVAIIKSRIMNILVKLIFAVLSTELLLDAIAAIVKPLRELGTLKL